MAVTPAQRKAKDKYDKAHYSLIQIKPLKEEAAQIKAYAESRGESVTRFLVRAAMEQIERDKKNENK